MDANKLNFKLDYIESSYYVNTLNGNYLKVSIVSKECTNQYSYDVCVIKDDCSTSRLFMTFVFPESKNHIELVNTAVSSFELLY